MKNLPLDLREQIIADFDAGMSYKRLQERYGISVTTIRNYLKLRRQTGSLAPRPHRGAPPRALNQQQCEELKRIRKEDPEAPQSEIAKRLFERCGVRVASWTISRYLKGMGISRRRLPKPAPEASPPIPKKSCSPRRYQKHEPPPALPHRKAYPSDLTDAEWEILEPLIPAAKSGGRKEEHPKREIVNAHLYVLRSGCQWRMLPHDFPPWQTVYDYFLQWRDSHLWERINRVLRERVRAKAGRAATPSAAIIDSQSVKTTERGGRTDMTEQND